MAKTLDDHLKRPGPLDDFTTEVIRLLLAIPRGKVATYGQLAELAGRPECSRRVGFILRTVVDADRVPWQRVIGASGRISFPKRNVRHRQQRKRLEAEGVRFDGAKVDLDRYRWSRRPRSAKGRAQPRMFSY